MSSTAPSAHEVIVDALQLDEFEVGNGYDIITVPPDDAKTIAATVLAELAKHGFRIVR
ncbi:hypothetical protein PBI_UTZ_67 [Gordonia phage Utz]|uniref:hypothetical protein n=1 Tax=Gordonia phage Utz TaxID=1838081 RepID=UPI0007B647F2|nr:hypothetical protein BH796_gp67 [Gordonia phage Utz]ANA86934.1 hypothetical protein PBI_UTZ_67 [Gordonia phage Utz]